MVWSLAGRTFQLRSKDADELAAQLAQMQIDKVEASSTGTYNGKAVREVIFNFEDGPCGRSTTADIKYADDTKDSITDAEALLAKVQKDWKWKKSDGEMGAYGGFAVYEAKLKGSIGEGPNQTNYSDQSLVYSLKIQEF